MSRLILIAILLLIASPFVGCKKRETAGTDPTKPVELSLGKVSTGNGIRLQTNGDGRSTPAEVGGSACRTVPSGKGAHAYLYFSIDPKIKLPELKNGKVVVEYFDSGKGELRMQYDGSNIHDDGKGAYSGSGKVETLTGELAWKTVAFPFHDAVFKNRQNGRADFRIEALKTGLSIRKVTVLREEKP